MSFLTLGIFWVSQQTQLDRFTRSDRWLTWIHLAFLFAVTLMPFSTGLLAVSITSRLALVVYWLNLLLLGLALLCGLRYAKRAGLVKGERAAELGYERYILVAQALYAFAVALCIISTYVSIAFLSQNQGASLVYREHIHPKVPAHFQKCLYKPGNRPLFSALARYLT